LCWSLEHAGPIGATVADVVTALAIGSGEPTPVVPESRRPRLGVCDAWWAVASNEVARVANQALDRLVAGGAERVSIDLPHLGLVMPVAFASFAVEAAAGLDPHLQADRPFSPAVRVLLESGRGVSAVHYVQAQRARSLIAADFARALERADLLVTPTTPITAPLYREDALETGEVDETMLRALTGFTFALNLTGLPAASVPCGHAPDGMPVGLQLIGAAGQDLLTLAVAAEVERTAEMLPPAIWHPLL
jgi:aspartyl-tRNA(Asn)/glutamyl-tRNA(Gln) amidotransferase subunit A